MDGDCGMPWLRCGLSQLYRLGSFQIDQMWTLG